MTYNKIKPKINEDILWRYDGKEEDIVILASCKGGGIQFLNQVAGLILEYSDGTNEVDSIVNKIVDIFGNVEKKRVEMDVINFLNNLKKLKIVNF